MERALEKTRGLTFIQSCAGVAPDIAVQRLSLVFPLGIYSIMFTAKRELEVAAKVAEIVTGVSEKKSPISTAQRA